MSRHRNNASDEISGPFVAVIQGKVTLVPARDWRSFPRSVKYGADCILMMNADNTFGVVKARLGGLPKASLSIDEAFETLAEYCAHTQGVV